ncbi:leucyl aminopeptidase [Nocardioides campestrisoli]|uniref:leucyl aminopeptidase n=1 Tax=Nocardioides campestrisoli TaxID=2736757 RepID=UPI001CD5BAAB|nr:leucyl aminopeptidase [Nocardioides campestrisoli]
MTTTYTLSKASPAKTRADAVVVGVLQSDKGPVLAPGGEDVGAAFGRKLRPMLSSLGVTGKAGEAVRVPTAGTLNAPVLLLVGLGANVDRVSVRRAAGVAARTVRNDASVALALPADDADLVAAATAGFRLGGYTFTTYRSESKDDSPADLVVLSPLARDEAVRTAFDEARVVADAVATTRDWVNEPPGQFTPELFADAVTAGHARLTKGRGAPQVTLEVMDQDRLAQLGCGGILGVGAGSDAPPRLVKISYEPPAATTHLALVGKGITFDSGGLTIKPSSSMGTMKSDMAGAAAVIQATFAIAALGLPIRVTTWAPMAENMVSGSSIRPGDVLTIRGGRTVEVLNTDAEGRLVLADALVLAGEEEPDLVVDVATLTGHMVLALGDKVCGVLGTDDVVEQVLDAGRRAGEAAWPMPIPEEMSERIRSSKVADLAQHDWVRWGGGLYAAAFLREFTEGRPWAHLDIAGPSFNSGGPFGDWTSGGTGFGVATLVELARALATPDADPAGSGD